MDSTNKLKSDSVADAFQIKSISNYRFVKKIGTVSHARMKEIVMGVNVCLGS